MQYSTTLGLRLDIDTTAKTVAVVFTVPADDGQGDVEILRHDVTSTLTAADKQKLRRLFTPPAKQ